MKKDIDRIIEFIDLRVHALEHCADESLDTGASSAEYFLRGQISAFLECLVKLERIQGASHENP